MRKLRFSILLLACIVLNLVPVTAQDDPCTQQAVAASYAAAVDAGTDIQQWNERIYATSDCPEAIKNMAHALMEAYVPSNSESGEAQPLPLTQSESADNFTFLIPSGWAVDAPSTGSIWYRITYAANGELISSLNLYALPKSSPLLTWALGVEEDATMEELATALAETFGRNGNVPREDIISTEGIVIKDRKAIKIHSGSSQYDSIVVFFQPDEESYGMITSRASKDVLSQYEPTILAIAESVEYHHADQLTFPTGDLGQIYTSPDGTIQVSYPTGWAVDTSNPRGIRDLINISIANSPESDSAAPLVSGQCSINVIVAQYSQAADDETVIDTVVGDISTPLIGFLQPADAAPEYTTINGRVGGLLRLSAGPGSQFGMDTIIVVIDYGDGIVGIVNAWVVSGELPQCEPTIMTIAESLVYDPAA